MSENANTTTTSRTDRSRVDAKTTVDEKSTGKNVQVARDADSALDGGRGTTSIADIVVAKIAGIATREIGGVYDLGGAAERVVGKVRDVLPGGTATTQGIEVEVGETQAAVDVSIVAEYGVAIHRLAGAIRRNVIDAIEQMTSLQVTEVNVTVHDIHLAGDDETDDSRVQ